MKQSARIVFDGYTLVTGSTRSVRILPEFMNSFQPKAPFLKFHLNFFVKIGPYHKEPLQQADIKYTLFAVPPDKSKPIRKRPVTTGFLRHLLGFGANLCRSTV
ncbi:hypothetical protein [Neobacillus piezotolerans]|uniref:hypothetical protein n=1 Tax=Neobacillus piezotolerans TaxID=2259171 RepID=UPI0011586D3E|nr:hypothetical protein [Neobacillus piezotolerans]